MSASSSHGRGKAVPQESEMQGSDVLDEVRGHDRRLRGCKLAWNGWEARRVFPTLPLTSVFNRVCDLF
jgi:hypothetical protein